MRRAILLWIEIGSAIGIFLGLPLLIKAVWWFIGDRWKERISQ